MDDLVQWLGQQLDEDERIAQAVEDRSAPWDGQWVADGDDAARTFNGHVLFYGHGSPLKPGLVAHVVAHDPARVLREIDAKRQLLRTYEEAVTAFNDSGPAFSSYDRLTGSVSSLRRAVELLALPYADRPGYRDDWRP